MCLGAPGAVTIRVSGLSVGKLSGPRTGRAGWDHASYSARAVLNGTSLKCWQSHEGKV